MHPLSVRATARLAGLSFALCGALVVSGCAHRAGPNDAGTAVAQPAKLRADAPPTARKVVLAMTGSKQVTEARDWPDFKREWRETFAEHAKERGVAFSFADGDLSPRGEDGTLLVVHVEDYRMVGIGSRIFFGAMTGNAYINSKVRLLDLRDGRRLGEQSHNTETNAWGGVAAHVTPQQVNAIAKHLFTEVTGMP